MTKENPNKTLFFGFVIVAVLLLAVLTSFTLNQTGTTIYRSDGDGGLSPEFWTALYSLATLAILVERAVEVLMNTAGQNPDPVFDPKNNVMVKFADRRPMAAKIAMVLGLVLAASGVRILETLVEIVDCTTATPPICTPQEAGYFFRFSDIAISAGIMAGSADTLHPYIQSIGTFGTRLKNAAAGLDPPEQKLPTVTDPVRFRELTSPGKTKPPTPPIATPQTP